MEWFYHLTTNMMRGALWGFSRWRVNRLGGPLPREPFILVSNHLSITDPPLLSASIPRRIVYMAKTEAVEHWLLGYLAKGINSVPVRRGAPDRAAIRAAIDVLKEGRVLGMFPEGTRSLTSQLLPGHPGTALIALRANVPLVPAAITGSQEIDGLGVLLKRAEITVTLGPAFRLSRPTGRLTADLLQELTDDIMLRIARLLPEEYRGAYAEAAGRETREKESTDPCEDEPLEQSGAVPARTADGEQ
jgi:1-acyl-sn-glycerol-3-phosphate acyltransferase